MDNLKESSTNYDPDLGGGGCWGFCDDSTTALVIKHVKMGVKHFPKLRDVTIIDDLKWIFWKKLDEEAVSKMMSMMEDKQLQEEFPMLAQVSFFVVYSLFGHENKMALFESNYLAELPRILVNSS